jgi:chromosome segregation ATPase
MSELNNLNYQPSDDDADLSLQAEIDKIMFSFQIESDELKPKKDLLANNIIDDIVNDFKVESEVTVNQINSNVNIYDLPVAEEPKNTLMEDLELENAQLKAKIFELETIIHKTQPEISQNKDTELLQQLEKAQQTIKNQQLMIETLSHQLAETQEQLSNLERECSEAQDNYNQQTYKLLETEKQLQELHKRLLRQQRYTLEYKTVLEECFREGRQTITKPQATESLTNQEEGVNVNHKLPKSHWPSPGIETQTVSTPKKARKTIDLPTFR